MDGKPALQHQRPLRSHSNLLTLPLRGRVIVVCVALINAHTWGLNSVSETRGCELLDDHAYSQVDGPQSYAIFLAYFLRSGIIENAGPLAFAFVGGLSISVGKLSRQLPFRGRAELLTSSAAFIVSPIVTLAIRTFGTRYALLIGVFLEACVVVLALIFPGTAPPMLTAPRPAAPPSSAPPSPERSGSSC